MEGQFHDPFRLSFWLGQKLMVNWRLVLYNLVVLSKGARLTASLWWAGHHGL